MTATHLKLGLFVLLAVGLAGAGAGTLAMRPVVESTIPVKAIADKEGPEAGRAGQPAGRENILPPSASARLGNARFWPGSSNIAGQTLTFTPDSRQVAMAGADQAIYIWDAATGNEVARIGAAKEPITTPGTRFVSSLTFAPDGHLVAAVEQSGGIRIWDVKTNREVSCISAPGVHTCVFAPDGKTLAAPAGDGTVSRWDTATWKPLPAHEGHKGAVHAVAYAADGRSLASGGEDQSVRLWDPATGKLLRTLEGHRDRVIGVAFAPDGKTVASRSTDETVRIWDVESGKELASWNLPSSAWLPGQGNTYSFSFTSDGKALSATDGSGLRLFDVLTGEPVRRLAGGRGFGLAGTMSPNGKLVATAGYGQRVRVWDAGTGKELSQAAGHRGTVVAAAFSPDRKTLATGSRDRTVRLWDVATGIEARQLLGHSGTTSQLLFAPDGKHLATASADQNDRTVSWWDVATGQEVKRFPGHNNGVQTMALSVDGKQLTVLDREGILHFWELATGKETHQYQGPRYFQATFAPDNQTIVVYAGQPLTLQTWNSTKPEEPARPFDGQDQNNFPRVAFSPDGRQMISLGFDQKLQLWDLAARRAVRHVHWSGEKAPLTAGIVGALPAFSPDAKTLAVATKGGAVALIEVATGEERHVLQARQGVITVLAFSADGSRLVSGGEDGTTLVWDVKAIGEEAKPDAKPRDLEALWADLGGSNGAKAYRAIRALAASPREAVPFLRTHLVPGSDVEQKRVEVLLADLDSDDFATRKKAEQELSRLGLQAEPALRRALGAKPSLEVAQRLEGLLRALDDRQLQTEEVRAIRAVEALEASASDEARGLLREWAKGAPGTLLAEEARAALSRLGQDRF